MSVPMWVFLVQGWIESMAIAAAGMATVGIRFEARALALVGIFQSFIAWVVRHLPIRFGMHTIVLQLILSGLIVLWVRARMMNAIAASFTGLALLGAGEVVLSLVVTRLLNTSLKVLADDVAGRLIYGSVVPPILYVYAAALIRMRRGRDAQRGS